MLQFYSRKIFLEYLGNEILGLNSTAQNLLQFLNIAELGIGTAVSFTLFKPLHDKDETKINEIVTLQGMLYKRIGLLVLFGGIILMLFFPLIYSKIQLPLWYAYASFSVFLLNSLLSYFVNYQQIVLTANQEDYKIQLCYKPIQFTKILLQILVVIYLKDGYIWWLILEVTGGIFSAFTLRYVTFKSHKYLVKIKRSFKSLSAQYHDFTVKIKQLFVHKISSFALAESSPLIIYAYLDLTIVTYYINYQLIFSGVRLFLNAVFNSIGAGIGNLVVSEPKEHILRVFDELFAVRFWSASIICFCLWNLTEPFISLWIGGNYLLGKGTLILMILIVFLGIIRGAVESFIYAYGLYSDIWAAGAEAIINIGGSIIFGYFFGLNGILIGVVLSLLTIIMGWKPYFLFSRELKGYFKKYHFKFIKNILVTIPIWILAQYIINLLKLKYSLDILYFTAGCIITLLIITVLLSIDLYIFSSGFRDFCKRIIRKR